MTAALPQLPLAGASVLRWTRGLVQPRPRVAAWLSMLAAVPSWMAWMATTTASLPRVSAYLRRPTVTHSLHVGVPLHYMRCT